MTTQTCTYRSIFTDSGDRGADIHEHERQFHPDHEHVWGDSPYAWEQIGSSFVKWPERLIRTEAVQRCEVCKLARSDDHSGKCA